ncbi:hypothetical protein SCP_1700400 [Sparassis crispa]|uniref:PH domain-containing protein n=1 Tax=Sparassis crispa TaxID=139825 RepID=A0A401H5K3_9APHY|nr:hypothetical protein SCP_1700400 [Sparassis crispa]GBE89716.1 hypothetical protein SCP_1700400 [Sparassis crispa]
MSHPTSPSLPIACRFVPTDQWLVTHLQPSWSIGQVKQCLLAKFLSPTTSVIPSAISRKPRPISPITFGTDANGSNGSETDSELEFDAQYLKFKYTPGPSVPASTAGASSSSHNQPSTTIPERYSLIAFSTSQLLEDHFHLSWYGFRSYELLELHAGPGLVSLPRGVLGDYVHPYFEARVWALRVAPATPGDVLRKHRTKRKEDDQGEEAKDSQRERGRRRKMEWRVRWLVIHQGVFKLYNHRNDPSPAHSSSMSALLALRGAEHLQLHMFRRTLSPQRPTSPPSSATPMPIPMASPSRSMARTPLVSPALQARSHIQQHPSSPVEESDLEGDTHGHSRIVCAKFRVYPPSQAHEIQSRAGVGALSSTATEEHRERRSLDGGGWWRRGSKDELAHIGSNAGIMHEGLEDDAKVEDEAVWVIMDMLTDEAFTNVLRVLHRDAPRTCVSSFFSPDRSPLSPQSHPVEGYRFPDTSHASPSSRAANSLHTSPQETHRHAPTTSTGTSLKAPCPYPEWRLAVATRARRAGLGEVGRATEAWLLGSEATDYIQDKTRARRVTREESSDSEPDDDGGREDKSEGSNVGDTDPMSPDSDADDPIWTGAHPHYLAGDFSGDESSDEESNESDSNSEREWESWADDLPRQWQCTRQARPRKPSAPENRVSVVSSAWAGTSDNPRTRRDVDSSPRSGSPPPALATFSSMESLLWHTSRSPPVRARPQTPPADEEALSSSLPIPISRPRSPLSSLLDDGPPFSSYMPQSYEDPGARASSYESGAKGAKVVVPMHMAMTTITSTVSVGETGERKSRWKTKRKEKVKDKPAKKLIKERGEKEKGEPTQTSHALPNAFLRPSKLKVSTELGPGLSSTPVSSGNTLAPPPDPVSAVSMSSIDSLRFVTPEWSD